VRLGQRVAELDVELVVVDVVQEHVHPRQVVRGVVDFLPIEAFFDDVVVELLLGLQQQRAGTAGRVVDLVDAGLPMHRQSGNQLGDLLRGEELAAGFPRIGRVVGNQELVGIAEQVDVAGVEPPKIQLRHPFEHLGQAFVLVFDGIAQAVAGGVEIRKQPFDVVLGRVAVRRGFDGLEDIGKVRIQAFVGAGLGHDVDEQLAGIDEVALGLDGVILGGLDALLIVCHGGVVHARVSASDIVGEVLADETIEQGAQYVLLEVPAIDGTAHVIGDIPDLAL